MTTVTDLVADLATEHADLDRILAPLPPEEWARATPSPGWTVADQIGHLAYFDRAAALAITDGDAFKEQAAALVRQATTAGFDVTLDEARSLSARQLFAWWREGRAGLIEAAGALDEVTRLPWYGPDMGAKSFLTARL
ncbi:MAG: maleylpyruvate isomerase N-terminal domain-containing protein, partial [Acidimicrobiales bacterium]